jgi:hypothetical protein
MEYIPIVVNICVWRRGWIGLVGCICIYVCNWRTALHFYNCGIK